MEDKPSRRERLSALLSGAGDWLGRGREFVTRNLAELLAAGGAFAVADGVAEFNAAAGQITRGVLLIAGAIAVVRGR